MGSSANDKKKNEPISKQVAKSLSDMIFAQKRFLPGDKIPNERSLAVDLDVSRTSIREAIKILASNGVLEIQRGVGTFVSMTPGRKDDPFGFTFTTDKKKLLIDWYQARLILESEAMELVAKNATEEDLREISEIANKEVYLINHPRNGEDNCCGYTFMETDQAFHNALAKATHSVVMSKILPALQEWVYYGVAIGEYPRISRKMEENARESHKIIISFLQKRDGKGANLAMRYHMLRALNDIQENESEIEK